MSDSLVRVSRRAEWETHEADAGSTRMPRHAETARAAYHDSVDGVSAGISTARALAAAAIRIGQRPEPIGGPASLDGIYRPIGAAFPNNPTRRRRLVVRRGPGTTGLSPSPTPPSGGLGPGPPAGTLLRTTIRTPWAPDSQAGLFPVRSPLLGGILVTGARQFFRALDARRPHTTGNRGFATTDCRGVRRRGLGIYANRAAAHGEAIIRPPKELMGGNDV
ncbi:unnamed protein product [Prunus brigantina]